MKVVKPRVVIWSLIVITSVAVFLYAVYARMPYPEGVASDAQTSVTVREKNPAAASEKAQGAEGASTAPAPSVAPASEPQGEGAAAVVDSAVNDILAEGDVSASDFAAADESADVDEGTQVDETEPLYQ